MDENRDLIKEDRRHLASLTRSFRRCRTWCPPTCS